VNDERALVALHLTPKSRQPTRKPKVILMKKAGPIADRLTQPEIGGGHPIPKSAGSNQPNGQNTCKPAHNIEGVIGGAVINNHQLNAVIVLVPYTFQCRSDKFFAVVRRHNDR
jgi:hypothetical protein